MGKSCISTISPVKNPIISRKWSCSQLFRLLTSFLNFKSGPIASFHQNFRSARAYQSELVIGIIDRCSFVYSRGVRREREILFNYLLSTGPQKVEILQLYDINRPLLSTARPAGTAWRF